MKEADHSKTLRETIRILERRLGTLSEHDLPCCRVTMAQCHALVEIGRAGNISLNELAELLGLENSTMSRTVNNLVTNGLVKRDINAKDRRYVTISLTERGKEVFEDIEGSMDGYYRKLYETIPEDKRSQVIESLQVLNEVIAKNK